jgi:hypothetical protein
MCTVLLPPGVNPIAVNKYINICALTELSRKRGANPSLYSDVFELEQMTLSM